MQRKTKWRLGLVALLAVLFLGGGGWYLYQRETTAATSQRQAAASQSSSQSATSSASSSSSATTLTTNLSDQETAVAIMVYASRQLDDDRFSDYVATAKHKQQVAVTTTTITTAQEEMGVTHKGQGTLYSVAPGGSDPALYYTINQDQKVNFYSLDERGKLNYLGSVRWQTIINYLNKINAGDTVKALAQVVTTSEVKTNLTSRLTANN